MIKLSEISTDAPKGLDKGDIKDELKDIVDEIGELQEMLLAEKDRNLLVVFQGMDSSGKDGSTHYVFQKCSAAGVSAYSFKKPTPEEFDHDFLWRVHKQAPRKGRIKIFIRSHYEDVLIQRVHKWISEEHAIRRIEAINHFEELLQFDNNTTILKFYMHLSRERQSEKLQERLDEPHKHWKHNAQDWEEAKLWDEYRRCYEDAINRSTVPWIIVPVDQRWYRNYFIAKKVLETLRGFNLKWPPLPKDD